MGTVCRKQSQRKDEDYPGTCPCCPRCCPCCEHLRRRPCRRSCRRPRRRVPRRPRRRSPPLALLPPQSPLSEVPTPVLDVTSPTPLEPSMLPRGRPRLTPTTTVDTTDVDTDSATGATDTVSDTAVDTTGVRFCQDVLDLD